MKRSDVKARIDHVDQSLARLRAQRIRLLARATLAQRKRDTYQKILIGGAVLAAVLVDGVPAFRSQEELLAWLELRLTLPHERAAFDFNARSTR